MAHEMSGLQGWLKLDLDAIQARSDKVQNFTIQGFGVSEMLAAAELAVDSAEDVPALLARVRWLEKDNAAMQQEERDRARGGHWIEEFN